MFLSVASVSLLMFSSSVVASIVIVHANLRREHDAVVLYRRHLTCPSHTYATPSLMEISNCVVSTLSVSKPWNVVVARSLAASLWRPPRSWCAYFCRVSGERAQLPHQLVDGAALERCGLSREHV